MDVPEKAKRAPSAPVLLVHGALFRNIRHNPSESPREGLPSSAIRRTRPNAAVPQLKLPLNTPNKILLGSLRNGRGQDHVAKFLIWSRGGRPHTPFSATGRPIHSVFGARIGFSGSADRTALLPVGANPKWRPAAMLKKMEWPYLCNGSIIGSTSCLVPPLG